MSNRILVNVNKILGYTEKRQRSLLRSTQGMLKRYANHGYTFSACHAKSSGVIWENFIVDIKEREIVFTRDPMIGYDIVITVEQFINADPAHLNYNTFEAENE